MEKMQFIKITATYCAKNNLHRSLLESLRPLDCTLCVNMELALKIVHEKFQAALSQYLTSGGKATPPDYRETKLEIETIIRIPDVLIFAIYPVKQTVVHNTSKKQ